MESMWETTKYLCENIQGCKIAYTQSDEISLLLTDYDNIETCAWFDNNVQKMASISASMATLAFNKAFSKVAGLYIYSVENSILEGDEKYIYNKYGIKTYVNENDEICIADEYLNLADIYKKKMMSAMFDSRVFSLPKEEVVNYFIWRQQDAIRNSIQMVGRANFSNKQLNKKSCTEIQDMLLQEKGIN